MAALVATAASQPRPPAEGRTGVDNENLANHRVPLACLLAFFVFWIGMSLSPRRLDAWFLETIPTFIALPAAALTYRRFRFSDAAYAEATAFLVLHTIGAHYTYSDVPMGEWLQSAFGLERNHYDRLVHFMFGALMFRAVGEASGVRDGVRGRHWLFMNFVVLAWWSLFYELVEWWIAVIVAPEAGPAFLATQGDPWDAQKDMALACAGALLVGGAEVRRC